MKDYIMRIFSKYIMDMCYLTLINFTRFESVSQSDVLFNFYAPSIFIKLRPEELLSCQPHPAAADNHKT